MRKCETVGGCETEQMPYDLAASSVERLGYSRRNLSLTFLAVRLVNFLSQFFRFT